MKPTTITAYPVMLPTESAIGNPNSIYKHSENGRMALWKDARSSKDIEQHLYLTSKEEIKEGDVWIENQKYCSNAVPIRHLVKDRFNQKVIATTDKSLGLPLIGESFIKQWVKSNGTIESVELGVETVIINRSRLSLPNITKERIKTTQDNCVIIHQEEKKMYSMEEVLSFAKFSRKKGFGLNCINKSMFNKWIEENL